MSLLLGRKLECPSEFHQGFWHHCSAKRNVFGGHNEPLTLNTRSIYISQEKVLAVRVETNYTRGQVFFAKKQRLQNQIVLILALTNVVPQLCLYFLCEISRNTPLFSTCSSLRQDAAQTSEIFVFVLFYTLSLCVFARKRKSLLSRVPRRLSGVCISMQRRLHAAVAFHSGAKRASCRTTSRRSRCAERSCASPPP